MKLKQSVLTLLLDRAQKEGITLDELINRELSRAVEASECPEDKLVELPVEATSTNLKP